MSPLLPELTQARRRASAAPGAALSTGVLGSPCLGNTTRNQFTGPAYSSMDLAIQKGFKLWGEGKELSINVDADVNRRIAEIQSESKIADPEKFHEWVHQQTGQTFEDLKQQYHDAILTQRDAVPAATRQKLDLIVGKYFV